MLLHWLFVNALIILSCSGIECLNVKIINGSLNEIFTQDLTLDKDIEYLIQFDSIETKTPLRVLAYSEDAHVSSPILIVVKQKKEVVSWQLPMVVDGNDGSTEFKDTAKTLCYDMTMDNRTLSEAISGISHYNSEFMLEDSPIISISTSSVKNVSVNVTVMPESTFYILPDEVYNTTVTSSTPRVYFYDFPDNATTTDNTKTVILEVNSPDNICMTISIQNASCPVYDLNHNIRFEGYFETITTKGGITITKSHFPNGFFLVFVPKPDDYDCTMVLSTSNTERRKEITFKITPSIARTDYINAIILTLFCMFVFYFVFGICFFLCSSRAYVPRSMEYMSERCIEENPSTSRTANDNASVNEDYGSNEDASSAREVIFNKPEVFLCDLARKDFRILKKKSYFYLWHVLTVAVFYGLPVVQLVITYQKVLNDTGNQDLCYYNFLCAHPLGFFSDFNHILSNVGYLLLGLLYICIIYRRQLWHKDLQFDQEYGIPQHYGLFYALGVALMMEGVLSGSYHICPNHSNFQFDTSFMYVMAVLCMVKIYQNRHPDINATAYSTFGVLAVAIILGMWGIMAGDLYFWIFFTIFHILTGIYLTAQIYFMGCCKLDQWLFWKIIRHVFYDFWFSPRENIKPKYKGRFFLLLIGNLCNWMLAIFGILHHDTDFALHLLAIFMMNTLLYFIFYIVMKLCHKERINLLAVLFLLISLACAGAAMYCFLNKSISWAESPAESRRYNQDCLFMRFYDYHDVWHFLSAVGMFFIFMVVLLLDDDLSHTHRTRIHVF
ncbi:PREDICTED: SID1 transmembrane family member 1-like [Nicrophorus vespilloides]|uniref:SID1 transmembrane family member 1-like n=1 Tax=Nicrophorus vespilloides TaxID=110193 RepID=A0ABM1MS53_NICVS|nr:PREDICTED: SID1 transmembrane family member 1-like [Nicrophorus vespilloides]